MTIYWDLNLIIVYCTYYLWWLRDIEILLRIRNELRIKGYQIYTSHRCIYDIYNMKTYIYCIKTQMMMIKSEHSYNAILIYLNERCTLPISSITILTKMFKLWFIQLQDLMKLYYCISNEYTLLLLNFNRN